MNILRNNLESIFLPDESEEVELTGEKLGVSRDFVKKHQKPVGQLILKNDSCPNGICRFGSGTLISPDLFLTAAHCFKKGGRCECDSSFDFWCAPGCLPINKSSVSFNYQNTGTDIPYVPPTEREKIFPIKEIVETGETLPDPLDYLILRLTGCPGNIYTHAKLSTVEVEQNAKVCIIGHPNQSVKKIAVGKIKELDQKKIYYDIDTEESSSGSGIIDTLGNIIGIHVSNPNTNIYHLNEGIKMTALLSVSLTLQSLLRPSDADTCNY